MSQHIYNGSLLVGIGLTSAGAGMMHLPCGLITAGLLVLACTVYTLHVVRRAG